MNKFGALFYILVIMLSSILMILLFSFFQYIIFLVGTWAICSCFKEFKSYQKWREDYTTQLYNSDPKYYKFSFILAYFLFPVLMIMDFGHYIKIQKSN